MMLTFDIMPAEINDVEKILEIEACSFSSPWSRQMFLDDFSSDHGDIYLARCAVSKRILGYICFSLIVGELHILNLAVDVPYRRNKVATRLLDYIMELAEENGAELAFLEVRESNKGVVGIYKSAGFFEIAKRKKYYSDNGEDAIVMVNYLKGAL